MQSRLVMAETAAIAILSLDANQECELHAQPSAAVEKADSTFQNVDGELSPVLN